MALTIQELLALKRLCDDSTDPELLLDEDELATTDRGVDFVQLRVPGYGTIYVQAFLPATEEEA